MWRVVKKHLESRMLGNLHVRFGVGVRVELPGLHHIELEGESFAPGFFVWNSEVGRRTVGIQTFWFQQICQNHIVWDAVEVFDLKRKHTANVHRGLDEIRHAIHQLVAKRDSRRDRFAEIVKRAMVGGMAISIYRSWPPAPA